MRSMPDQPRPLKTAQPVAAEDIPQHRAQALMDGGNIAHIKLDGQIYTLRITRAGKLILTK